MEENKVEALEEVKQPKKKSKVLLVILLVILFLIAVAGSSFGGYLFGKNNCKKVTSNCDAQTSVTEKEIEKAEDFDIKEAEKILDKFGINMKDNEYTVLDNYYSDEYKRWIVFKNMKTDIEKECSELYDEIETNTSDEKTKYKTPKGYCIADKKAKVFPYEEVNKMYNDMFGTDIAKEGYANCPDVYDYNEKEDAFVLNTSRGCGFEGGPKYEYSISEIKSAKKIGNKIYIDIYHDSAYMQTNAYTKKGYFNIKLNVGVTSIDADTVEEVVAKVRSKYLNLLPVYEVELEQYPDHYQLNRVYIRKSS